MNLDEQTVTAYLAARNYNEGEKRLMMRAGFKRVIYVYDADDRQKVIQSCAGMAVLGRYGGVGEHEATKADLDEAERAIGRLEKLDFLRFEKSDV
jgi:hypothetical protein